MCWTTGTSDLSLPCSGRTCGLGEGVSMNCGWTCFGENQKKQAIILEQFVLHRQEVESHSSCRPSRFIPAVNRPIRAAQTYTAPPPPQVKLLSLSGVCPVYIWSSSFYPCSHSSHLHHPFFLVRLFLSSQSHDVSRRSHSDVHHIHVFTGGRQSHRSQHLPPDRPRPITWPW